MTDNCKIDVAAIYFPSWHVDEKNEKLHGKSWSEWELVKNARPLYVGHHQPRVPTWGHFDEASVEYAEKQIDLAADHGITVFHVDWYWYGNGPYLNRPLDEALLKASNNHRLKFGIMWANHDWKHIFPMPRSKEKAMIFPSEYDERAMEGRQDYTDSLSRAEVHWEKMARKLHIPYYPILTQGWDSSPRGEQFAGAGEKMHGYPWYPIVENNTPELFERAARMVRDFALRQPYEHKIVFVNAWNEWTEGSYLLPDEKHGLAYLEALKRVFVRPGGARVDIDLKKMDSRGSEE